MFFTDYTVELSAAGRAAWVWMHADDGRQTGRAIMPLVLPCL
jgi:hypothetical protein